MKVESVSPVAAAVEAERAKSELKKVCKQFEAIFLRYLLKEMRETVPNSGFLGHGLAFDIARSMHDDALAEELSRNNGIGIAEQLYRQLSRYV
ncbi:rod-binding protein [Thermosediminibacter litoriperuensis]|uniref:Flagellar protein FlgJ n=1 Tax=Thermosediminibacter litoriperuensis TaxID=291989 RepID=A0A5S5B0Q9_9FIRM|nr:rod-binding protein [Thermosediminibacter litoriperuensis]TYP58806.1 flagellar protein FlgJ [Thermosediminibacter litoriperuensis]